MCHAVRAPGANLTYAPLYAAASSGANSGWTRTSPVKPHGVDWTTRLRVQENLDGAALVHCLVAFGRLVERQSEVEDLARVDLPVPDQLDQLGQEAAHGGGAAVQVHVGEEQLHAGQGDVVRDADVAEVPAGAGGADGLHHRLLGADRFDDRVRAEPAGEVLDPGHAHVAAFGDDVRGPEVEGEFLAGLVPAHRDDAFRAELLGRQHTEQPDRAVTDHGDGLARPGFGGHRSEPAGTQHIGSSQQARDQIVRRDVRRGDQGAVGQGGAQILRLAAQRPHANAVDARALVAGPANLAGVVGGEERADHELPRPHVTNVAADLLDDADVLV